MFTWKRMRRLVQIGVLVLFLSPLVGNKMVLGTLNSSTILGITLTDPLAFLEVLAASKTPAVSILPGVLMILGIYLLLGKAYCSWVCPVGFLVEIINNLQKKLRRGKVAPAGDQYYWSLPVVLSLALFTGLPLFQTVSPIGIALRGLLFGMGVELTILIFIIVLEMRRVRRSWCRIFCPLGAFYALLGRVSPLKIQINRAGCLSCQSCLQSCNYCSNALKNLPAGQVERLKSPLCTKCGECIDTCPAGVLKFAFTRKGSNRLTHKETAVSGENTLSRRRLLETGGAVLTTAILFPVITVAKNTSPPLLRPPGAVPESEFLARCIRCGKCMEVCSYQTLQCGDALLGAALGTPYFEAREMPCYLCMECPDVCPSGALQPLELEEVKIGTAEVDQERCYAYQGDICRSCWLNCPLIDEALYMKQFRYPVIDEDKCTGCGICAFVCVMEEPAIKISSIR